MGEPGFSAPQSIPDAEEPSRLVREHVDALAPGSYLALSAPTADHKVSWRVEQIVDVYATSTIPVNVARSKAGIERSVGGIEIVPPYEGAGGVVAHAGLWGAEDPDAADDDASRWFYAAVARKR